MRAPTQPQRTPPWLLERIALEELPPAELAAARSRLLQEPDGPQRLAALLAADDEILRQRPPEVFAAAVSARAAQQGASVAAPVWRRLWWPVAAFASVASATVIVAILMVQPPPAGPAGGAAGAPAGAPTGDPPGAGSEPAPTERDKGLLPYLVVHRRQGASSSQLDPGAPARPGDLLRLGYVAPGPRRWGVLCSLDGAGAVTLHLPARGGQASPLEADTQVLLPFAYELDAAPTYERFVLVSAEHPFDSEAVLAAARALAQRPDLAVGAPLGLPSTLQQATFVLRKQP